MITIDKLCYTSRLRYENAGEKFAFAMLTLLMCVISRSMVVAGIVLVVTGGQLVYYRQCLWYGICNSADPDGIVSSILPVLSVYEHTDAGYSAGT